MLEMPEPPPLPLRCPPTGSASPSTSYTALWGYIQPALDHIIYAPTDTLSKAPAIEVSYHMGIHTAVYNYFTASQPQVPSAVGVQDSPPMCAREAQTAQDFYDRLDRYFAAAVTDIFLGLPDDDDALVHHLLDAFVRYRAGAGAVDRLLNYINRQYVQRSTSEGRGWFQVKDVLDDVAAAVLSRESGMKVAGKIQERRTAELSKWGAVPGADEEALKRAEACAEAASSQDRVVPLASMALRRFRLEVIEPLLVVAKVGLKSKVAAKAKPKPKPKPKGKAQNGSQSTKSGAGSSTRNDAGPSNNGAGSTVETKDCSAGPKGRLAQAVHTLLGSKAEERQRLARELADMMRMVGVQPSQPLLRRLEKVNLRRN